MKKLKSWLGAVAVMALVGSASVQAFTVPVVNASFEDPVLGDGGHTNTMPAPWVLAGFGGVINPTSGQVTTVPDGQNIAWMNNPGSLTQVLGDVLGDNTYDLSVSVLQRNDISGTFGYLIELLAGGTVLTSTSGVSTGSGFLLVESLQYVSSAIDPLLGQALGIRLTRTAGGSAVQSGWDNVVLTGQPNSGPSVPIPATAFLLSVGVLLLAFVRRGSVSKNAALVA